MRKGILYLSVGAALLFGSMGLKGTLDHLSRHGVQANQKHDHNAAAGAVHQAQAGVVNRNVAGPMVANSSGASAELKVTMSIARDDKRAGWDLPAGIPAGEKVRLSLKLKGAGDGTPLKGLAPKMSIKGQANAFGGGELLALAGPSGILGVLGDSRGHGGHAAGSSVGTTLGATFSDMVKLPDEASEAVIDRSGRLIFVTLPEKNQVAIVDAVTRSLVRTVRVGARPAHLLADSRGQGIWVAGDDGGSITGIDPSTYRTTTIHAGKGHHDLTFPGKDRLMFATNRDSGTVSMIDAELGEKLGEAATGSEPHGVDYSPRTHRLFVANEGSGTVSAFEVKQKKLRRLAILKTGKGASQVKISPDGKTGVVSNTGANTITLFDTSSNKIIKNIASGKGPGQIVFLDGYALVRNSLSPDLTYVNIAKPGVSNEIKLGSEPVAEGRDKSTHARIFVAPDGGQVYVPSPAEGQMYTIHLMNGEPMLMKQTKTSIGTDFLLSSANKTIETRAGTYERTFRVDRPGSYLLTVRPSAKAEPLTFSLKVSEMREVVPWKVRIIPPAEPYTAGRQASLRFRVLRIASGRGASTTSAKTPDGTITVYRFAAGGSPWQRVLPARHQGDGVYQASVRFPDSGTFSAIFTSRRFHLASENSGVAKLRVGK